MEAPLSNASGRRHRLPEAGLALCLFAIVLGARWAAFDRFGSDMPNWDQWDAEALHLLVPWFQGDHFLRHLFLPHNEHRVVLTKLQNLALVLWSGQWDARLQGAANAVLPAGLAVAFWLLGRRWTDGRWHAPLFGLVAALFGLPLAWENILGGFHSQQFWLVGLSFAAITLTPPARTGSTGWWCGCAAAVLALGSMASGFFAAVIVIGLIGLRLWRREIPLRAAAPIFILMTVVIAVGVLTRVTVAYHDELKAKSVAGFLIYLLRSLGWPLRGHDWTGAILWLPWLQVIGRLAGMHYRRAAPGAGVDAAAREFHADLILAGLGGWVLLQVLATAYARGSGAEYPAPRYMDTLAFGAAVNGLALAWLLSVQRRAAQPDAPPRPVGALRPMLQSGIAIAWVVTLGAGLNQTLVRNLREEMPATRGYYARAESHLRGYLATNDPAHLGFPDIPYPTAEGLVERLAHPSLRALMPGSVRAPLDVQTSAGSTPAFLENRPRPRLGAGESQPGLPPGFPPLPDRVSWGSFGPAGAAATGHWSSAPLASALGGWLKFEVAGQPGGPGATLELRDARSGLPFATVRPDRMSGAEWRTVHVRAPAHPFVIAAQDDDPSGWLAFSAPVEVSGPSYWAWRATRLGLPLAGLAGAIAVLLGLGIATSPPRVS